MNHTISKPAIKGGEPETLPDRHPDTIIYEYMTPRIFASNVGVIPMLGHYLRWANRTVRMVEYVIIIQGGEEVNVSRSYTSLAAQFYGRQTPKSGRESARRMVMISLSDMQASGFVAFRVKPGHIKSLPMKGKGRDRRADLRAVSSDQYVDSEYLPGVFFDFFRSVQARAVQADLFALGLEERNRKLYAIVQSVAWDMGARPIEQAPEEGAENNQVAWKHKTKAQLERGLSEWEGAGVRLGLNAEQLGLKLPTIDRKLDLHATQARLRVKHEIQRGQGQELPPDVAVRSRGRIGLETAIAGLEEARRAAQDLHLTKYDDYLQRIIEKLSEGWERAFSAKTKTTQE